MPFCQKLVHEFLRNLLTLIILLNCKNEDTKFFVMVCELVNSKNIRSIYTAVNYDNDKNILVQNKEIELIFERPIMVF